MTTTTAPNLKPTTLFSPLPLLLTIRFSTSLPDLDLDIPSPQSTTVVALKHLIRARLPSGDAARRLRFIHQGKILPDRAALGSVLRSLPPPPPPPPPPSAVAGSPPQEQPGAADSDPLGKGKHLEGQPATARPRTYINCSIGDPLADSELADEADLAALPPAESSSSCSSTASTAGRPRHGPDGTSTGPGPGAAAANPPPRPQRGFDRLLSTGFTPAEVNALRLQFRSLQELRHTRESMPSPDTLRSMEDAWIDSNAQSGGGGGGGTGGGAAGGERGDGGVGEGDEGFSVANGALDVLVQGMLMGFFWPLGAFGWLLRDEAILPPRWHFVVGVGVGFSVMIGAVKAISGDR